MLETLAVAERTARR
ncbi:hypothetical protein EYF80_044805 [Liparis tanakae]|uniref:Uncharacterized protein n=1 Tax=Liparis tanakae TaxID=230148 RepID=A0A4Z2FVR4_9TELE|nr:hypothetical protein EYF80_044805 [Liparis tanakae]